MSSTTVTRKAMAFAATGLLLAPTGLSAHHGEANTQCLSPVTGEGIAGVWRGSASRRTAARRPADAVVDPVPGGRAVGLDLVPAGSVEFASDIDREREGQGGIVAVRIAEAGTYCAALDGHGWIDLVRDGEAVAPAGHGQGPEGSGIAKIITYTLEPGIYIVELSNADTDRARLLVGAADVD